MTSSTVATSHAFTLTGLATNTTYHFQALATDAQGNTSTSTDLTFKTATSSGSSDTSPPTVPTGLSNTGAGTSQLNFSWNPSTDNVAVTGYDVYRNSVNVGTTTATAFNDTGLSLGGTYTYTVDAFDAAGNVSAQSSSTSATTLGAGGGGGSGGSGGGGGGGGGGYYTPTPTPSPTSAGTSAAGSAGGASSPSASTIAAIVSIVGQVKSLATQLFVSANPSRSARPLMLGSQGTDVWALQIFLELDGAGPSSLKLATIGPTGSFGPLTKAALAEYQASVGITPASGYFGPMTRAKILVL